VPEDEAVKKTSKLQTPAEYLGEVRSAYAALTYDDQPDETLLELTKRDLEKLGTELPRPGDGYDAPVGAIAEEIETACIQLWSVNLSERCSIGPLEHPSVNARCFRSPEGIYALVIHHGLMNILHKSTKLIVAARDPTQVVYCNRKPPEELTSDELLEWADELGMNYLSTGATRGAMLKLSNEAMHAVGVILHLAETFVLGHEAGHFLAGHLEDERRFVADEYVPWLEVFGENERHEDEFEADTYGFEIMHAAATWAPVEFLHSGVVAAFSVMGLIGGDVETATHPASSARYSRIADRFGLPAVDRK
jgi:hypothetical protein